MIAAGTGGIALALPLVSATGAHAATPAQAPQLTKAAKTAVVPNVQLITYKVVAASNTNADGEEGIIPVISRRVLVQESLPLPIRNACWKPRS